MNSDQSSSRDPLHADASTSTASLTDLLRAWRTGDSDAREVVEFDVEAGVVRNESQPVLSRVLGVVGVLRKERLRRSRDQQRGECN